MKDAITFVSLAEVEPAVIAAHMSHPRMADHMPLINADWDAGSAARFVAKKMDCWARDGLGHWAFLVNGRYAGWGGFQKEGEEWDFGLVLHPDAFGAGPRIIRMALDFAVADARIPYVTFLLPPSRKNFGALRRLGAERVGEVTYEGAKFLKFRLETERRPLAAGAGCDHPSSSILQSSSLPVTTPSSAAAPQAPTRPAGGPGAESQ